jgi:type I restriction enzyme M protein
MADWLWDAACAIRGAMDAPKFKDFILPLVFYKRLSDVFDDEFAERVAQYGGEDAAREIVEADHEDALKHGRKPIVRFYIPGDYSWEKIRTYSGEQTLGEFLTDAMRTVARLNPSLQGVVDTRDYNERQSGQRTLDDDRLAALIQVLSRHRLGLKNTEPDVIGRAYEYLLRKFAEGQGQSAGEFFTPPQVGWLIAGLIKPKPKSEIYDPTCGSGGLLIKSRLLYEHDPKNPKAQAPHLYGQEMTPTTFAIAKMNMFLYGFDDSSFAIGDTLRNPGFGAQGAGLKQFDYVVANPMWNQKGYDTGFYEADQLNRFARGVAPSSSADWGWVQHMLASLGDDGRAAIVLDTGAVSRGSGSSGRSAERDIRKQFVEDDLIEGVVLLPENLFYNTTAPGIILLLDRNKPVERRGQFLLINASAQLVKEKPKNVLTDDGIAAIGEVYAKWETREKLSRVVTLEEVRKADYNLSPSQFVQIGEKTAVRPLTEIIADLQDAGIEREEADDELAKVLAALGFDGGLAEQ